MNAELENQKNNSFANEQEFIEEDSMCVRLKPSASQDFEAECENKTLSNFEKYSTIVYITIIVFLCIFFAFNDGAKQAILAPLKEIKEFNIKWFFILMSIGIPLVAIGFPLTILELSVASAIGEFWPAFLLCYCTKVSGNMVSFFLGRWLLQDKLKVLLCKNRIYKTLIFAVKISPLKFALLFKFLPIPHIIKSYALAITPIWWVYFLIASLIPAFIYASVWVYLGTTLREMYEKAEKTGKVELDSKFIIARFGFLILSFGATIYIVYYSKCIFDQLEVQRKEEKKRLKEEAAEGNQEKIPVYGTFENK